ncbi:hypothetical protein SMACR_06687 [Sordaria macrospora]|uniref:RING-type domain-containing protein n=2 Tax=Sordaria macrospora TaxID=5147 RepID=A0A8S8ZIG3_SORMA|nr:hypothetical protein SMACR_06687 [Sordaria macrospora]WPJ62956.1 hypothetical protein SMAC4_06687 [Sordaria macrospora]
MDDDFPFSDAAYDDIFADLDPDAIPPPLSSVAHPNPGGIPQSLPSLAPLLQQYPAPNQNFNSDNSQVHNIPGQTTNTLPSLSIQLQGCSPANLYTTPRNSLPCPHPQTRSQPGRYLDNCQSQPAHLPPASNALPPPRLLPPSLSFLLPGSSSTPNNRGTSFFNNTHPTFSTNLAIGSRAPGLPVTTHRGDREPNSDDFLNELASRDFSSPSHPPQTPRHLRDHLSPSRHNFNTMPSRRDESAAEGSRRRSRGASHHIASLPTLPPQSSGAPKRKREDGLETRTNKRKAHVLVSSDDEKDPFGDNNFMDVVDLADTEEVPESMRAKPKPKNEIKLSAFQCVICMDNVTGLTVTHCGHLFCSECLHSALTIDPTKRTCPVCRQKIDKAPSGGKWTSKAKGYYPLELKLVTKKSLGKRAAQ